MPAGREKFCVHPRRSHRAAAHAPCFKPTAAPPLSHIGRVFIRQDRRRRAKAYGPDSFESQALGLKRKSERKRPARRTVSQS
jgi:hypothetical protein